MILHVTFTDGSNPWVSLPGDRQMIIELWNMWPSTAIPKAYNGAYICERADDNAGYWVYKRGEFWDTVKRYKRLGNALAALERLGGEYI